MDNLIFDQSTNTKIVLLENKLKRWAQPPSASEIEKCDRAIRMIREAISKLSIADQITIFPKGSFKNRTNIPSDSDVDVGVRLNSMFINDYPPGTTAKDFNFYNLSYSFEDFRQAVTSTIQNYFGSVEIGNKSIKIRSNTCRVNADVVPLCIHRRYYFDRYYNKYSFHEGVALSTAQSIVIKNWPQQNYDNGVKKNNETNRKFKGLVRILKNLRNEMKENDSLVTENIPSFLIECLLWNFPNDFFKETYLETIIFMLDFLLREIPKETTNEWVEINQLKYLFGNDQKWTQEQVVQFCKNTCLYLNV